MTQRHTAIDHIGLLKWDHRFDSQRHKTHYYAWQNSCHRDDIYEQWVSGRCPTNRATRHVPFHARCSVFSDSQSSFIHLKHYNIKKHYSNTNPLVYLAILQYLYQGTCHLSPDRETMPSRQTIDGKLACFEAVYAPPTFVKTKPCSTTRLAFLPEIYDCSYLMKVIHTFFYYIIHGAGACWRSNTALVSGESPVFLPITQEQAGA